MRTLLLLLALSLLTLAAGCMGNPFVLPRSPGGSTTATEAKARKHYAIEVIRKMKGEVRIDAEDPDKSIVSVDLHGIRSAPAALASLGPLPKLRELNLFETGFTDADVESLRGFTHLQTLNLSSTRVTDAGLAYLQSLPNLRKLYLNDTRISDSGLRYVRGLTHLTDLGLFRTPVTDVGLTQLVGLTKLEKLTLGGSSITDRSLVSLRRMKNLRELYTYQTRVSNAAIEDLKLALPELKIVH